MFLTAHIISLQKVKRVNIIYSVLVLIFPIFELSKHSSKNLRALIPENIYWLLQYRYILFIELFSEYIGKVNKISLVLVGVGKESRTGFILSFGGISIRE